VSKPDDTEIVIDLSLNWYVDSNNRPRLSEFIIRELGEEFTKRRQEMKCERILHTFSMFRSCCN
jgi:hypothetical protein